MRVQICFNLRHTSQTSYVIECEGDELLRFEDSGRKAGLGEIALDLFSWRDVLRWGAPFALAPQGRVVLHGSAVRRRGEGVVAFLGVGGAGKSTLARELGRRGWQVVADDMIVYCRDSRMDLRGESILREWSAEYAGRIGPSTPVDYAELAKRLAAPPPSETAPLAGLLFLDEAKTPGLEFRRHPLPGTELFCRLVHYGFGGLPCPVAWMHQFEVYGSLTAQAKGATLAAPDGLHRMRGALAQLEASLDEWLPKGPAACG